MNSLVQHILGTAQFVSGTRNRWQEIHYRQAIFALKKSCQVKSGFYIAVCKTRCLHTCKAATFFFFSLLMKVTFRYVGGNSSLALKAEWEQERPSSHTSSLPFPPLTRCQAPGKLPPNPGMSNVHPQLWKTPQLCLCCDKGRVQPAACSLPPASPYLCPQGHGETPRCPKVNN